MNRIVFAGAFFIAGCTGSPPSIQTADADRAVGGGQVSMSNIDASSEAGADRLLRRIRDAAQADCDVGRGLGGETMVARERACMQASMTSKVARVASPIVSARFTRVGATMIAAATARYAATANGQAPANADQHANANANLTADVSATRRRSDPTTDQLNQRESARLRAMSSPS